MAESHAWILTLSPNERVAVADREMIEYILDPSVEQVPMTPESCSEVLIHRDALFPLFDLNNLLGLEPLTRKRFAGLLAYQEAPRQPLRHLAVYLYGPPARIRVSDDWVTEPPERFQGALADLVLASFSMGELTVPIINVPYLGSARLLQALLREREGAGAKPATPEAAG